MVRVREEAIVALHLDAVVHAERGDCHGERGGVPGVAAADVDVERGRHLEAGQARGERSGAAHADRRARGRERGCGEEDRRRDRRRSRERERGAGDGGASVAVDEEARQRGRGRRPGESGGWRVPNRARGRAGGSPPSAMAKDAPATRNASTAEDMRVSNRANIARCSAERARGGASRSVPATGKRQRVFYIERFSKFIPIDNRQRPHSSSRVIRAAVPRSTFRVSLEEGLQRSARRGAQLGGGASRSNADTSDRRWA